MTRMMTPPFGPTALSILILWYPLIVNLFFSERCVSCTQAMSILCLDILSRKASFFLEIPSAFHWRILSGSWFVVWSVAISLFSPLLAPQEEEEEPPVALGGPLRGNGPGTPLSWRVSMSSAPQLLFTYLSTIYEVCYVVPQFAGTAVTPFCFICAFRPGTSGFGLVICWGLLP